MSATAKARSKKRLKDITRQMHQVTLEYERLSGDGGQVAKSKSFTFGDESLRRCQQDVNHHERDFRLVGGYVTPRREAASHTQLEEQRIERCRATAQRIRHLPVGFFGWVKTLKATSSQGHWGQGSHRLPVTPIALNELRTEVLKAAWYMEQYSSSAVICLTILMPVILDPHSGVIYNGLLSMSRAMSDVVVKQQARNQLAAETLPVDGFIARLH